MNSICPKCGVGFDNYSKWGPKKFCSRKCANSREQTDKANRQRSIKLTGRKLSQAHKDKLSGENNGKRKGKNLPPVRVIKTCLFCKKEYSAKSTQKYCSVECRRLYERKSKESQKQYILDCRFNFNVYDYPEYFDLGLVEKYGWYKAANRGNNLTGVSRDHMYSISQGFINNVDPAIISHPANCQLMLQNDNSSKKTKCDITLDELIERITKWGIGRVS